VWRGLARSGQAEQDGGRKRLRGFPGRRPRSGQLGKLRGGEKNWVPTVPGRGWFAYFRFYAPTEAYFDRSWQLPDIEKVK
jgi:hypothetical protein